MYVRYEKVFRNKEGCILIGGPKGEPVWFRPRTKREAGARIMSIIALGLCVAAPFAVALVFILT